MEQPIPTFAVYPHADRFLDALHVRQSILPVTVYDNGLPHVFAVLESSDAVATLEPDLAALTRLARDTEPRIVGFNVCAGAGSTWKTRMFAPADGVPEEPATGSAAGPLALHLARHGLIPWENEIRICQGAEIGRPSALFTRASGTQDHVDKIEVSGYAVAVGGGWFDGALLRSAIGG